MANDFSFVLRQLETTSLVMLGMVGYCLIRGWVQAHVPPWADRALFGLACGIMSAISLFTPFELVGGVRIGLTGICLMCAIIFGGITGGLVTLAVIVPVRLLMGGAVVPLALAVLLVNAVCTTAAVLWHRRRGIPIGWTSLFAIGLGNVTVAIALAAFFPLSPIPLSAVRTLALPFGVLSTLTIVMLGSIVLYFERERVLRRALQESEARFRAVIENSADMIQIVSPSGELVYRSPSCDRILGYTDADMLGKPFLRRVHPDDIAPLAAMLQQTVSEPSKTVTGTSRVRHKDGSWRYLSWAARDATNVPGVGGIVLNVRDTTDSVMMQEQLQQSQKMEAVGRLAGGIAHDFNNILGVIQGFTQFLIEDLPAQSPLVAFVHRIAKASDRAKQLVQQILAFARRDTVDRTPSDLGRIIGDAREILTSSLPSSIRFDVKIHHQGLVAVVNSGQIMQILLNLCINASDALAGEPGRITVELCRFTGGDALDPDNSDAWTSWGAIDPERPYARITVADTGPGMDQALLNQVFEPFFTTKQLGKGTGLGLSVVHGLVLSYEGAGSVSSRPGDGTLFSIYLPLTDSQELAETPTEYVAPGGRRRILLVDDHKDLADATALGLKRADYDVVMFHDPVSAMNEYAEHPQGWFAVVSDQDMPGMTGVALFQRLKTINSEVRFVLCTGFSDGDVERDASEAGITTVLIKPVSTISLAASIRALAANPMESAATVRQLSAG